MKPWTEAEIDTLVRLWPTQTPIQLAQTLGRSKHSIYGKARDIGLPSRFGPRLKIRRDLAVRINLSQAEYKDLNFKRGKISYSAFIRQLIKDFPDAVR